jgi:phytoene desaturase
MKKVTIIGAGPGGLAAGLILARKGYQVAIYEKDGHVGGRSQRLTLDSYHFETGPTFLLYLDAIKNVFKNANLNFDEYFKPIKIDPMYDLVYKDKVFTPTNDRPLMQEQINNYFKSTGANYIKFLSDQEIIFSKVKPFLERPFGKISDYLRPVVIANARYLHPTHSVYSRLASFFDDQDLIYAMSFQTKYLGMSAWKAPAFFTILSYLEHALGIYYIEGGINRIHQQMAELIKAAGGKIYLNTGVSKIEIEGQAVKAIKLNTGEAIKTDLLIANSDFAYTSLNLVDQSVKHRFNASKINKMDVSISAFMIYLGLDKIYDAKHHSIIFADDYHASIKAITEQNQLVKDLSIYVNNPSKIDKTLAPAGHSALYILVPVPNNRSKIDWHKERNWLRDYAISRVADKLKMNDLEKHIKVEKIITPTNWEKDYNVAFGAVFSLSHRLSQMLYFRPHNQYEDIKGLYLVGGGTHPGSGLPTIFQSAIISCDLIQQLKEGV